jgi:hypothetical protein
VLVGSLLLACAVVSPNLKDRLPPGHDILLGDALHRDDPSEPYLAPGRCATYGCHHVDLRGGWARYTDPETGERRDTRSPSCYQCHGRLWNTRYPEIIEVFHPTSGVVWRHGTSREIEWWGPAADSAALFLTRDFMPIDTLRTMHPTEGVARIDSVESAWGTGDTYRVQIVQSSGDLRFSQAFSICGPDDAVLVTRPASGEVVMQGEDMRVEWRCASGTTVDIFIHRDGERLDTFRRDAGNSGYAERPFPASWGTGTGYRIRVVDTEGITGTSEPFEIRAAPRPVGRSPEDDGGGATHPLRRDQSSDGWICRFPPSMYP